MSWESEQPKYSRVGVSCFLKDPARQKLSFLFCPRNLWLPLKPSTASLFWLEQRSPKMETHPGARVTCTTKALIKNANDHFYFHVGNSSDCLGSHIMRLKRGNEAANKYACVFFCQDRRAFIFKQEARLLRHRK